MNFRWPWTPPVEHRADSSYTDALVASITANAGGQTTAWPTATAALEACAGFVGRAFATAEVKAPGFATAALDPSTLSHDRTIALIRRGEVVFLIRVDRDGLMPTCRRRATTLRVDRTPRHGSTA